MAKGPTIAALDVVYDNGFAAGRAAGLRDGRRQGERVVLQALTALVEGQHHLECDCPVCRVIHRRAASCDRGGGRDPGST